jgi:pyruvate/2-oxoglutarate dehydrogenase complex dihydrolipoamide acyltransferase (E2) component
MKEFLALFFITEDSGMPALQVWLSREGQAFQAGDALFTYGEEGAEKTFTAPVPGTFKTFLCKEGESLKSGMGVAVIEVTEEIASRCEVQGLGKILSKEEAKQGMSYAEAASIRHPKGGLLE